MNVISEVSLLCMDRPNALSFLLINILNKISFLVHEHSVTSLLNDTMWKLFLSGRNTEILSAQFL